MKPLATTMTRKQALLVSALLTAPTLTQAAKDAGVSDVTAWRWLKLPAVQTAYREARFHSVCQAISRLQRITGTAVETLETIMHDPAASTSSRIASARCVLDLALRAVEIEDLAARVATLESRIAKQERH